MKKVFYTIASWFKSLFAKKQQQVTTDVSVDTVKETIEDKKQILRDFNKDKEEHKMVLSQTVRSEKPNKYSKNKYVVHMGDKKFSLTAKQDFFLTEIKILEDVNNDANINDVVIAFLNLKYQNSQMTPTQDELKPAYHKKTINYLVKCGAIKSTSKNHYRTNF